MQLRVGTTLKARPETVWQALSLPETFEAVTRGLLRVAWVTPRPTTWQAGVEYRLRVGPAWLPIAWSHTLRIVRVDAKRRVVATEESGGPLRVWNHQLRVEPAGPHTSRYWDVIDFDLGLLTPLAAPLIWGFFRYRQRRLRRLLVGQSTTP